jgi:hypothetical protein
MEVNMHMYLGIRAFHRRCHAAMATVFALTCIGACDKLPSDPLVTFTAVSDSTTSSETLPDYTISQVQDSTDGALNDLSTVFFHVRVVNIGATSETPTSVVMFVDGQAVQGFPIYGLARLEDTTVTFESKLSAGSHELLFGVDHPPTDTASIAESNETNNTTVHSMLVPYGQRPILVQETMEFSDLPSTIMADSTVQQAIQLAADSGFVVSSNAPMIRTEYKVDSVTRYTVAFSSPNAPARTAPTLVILNRAGDTPVTFGYLFQIIDDQHFVAYSKDRGIRVSSQDGVVQLSGIGSQVPCSEGVVWPWACMLERGAEAITPIANEIFAHYSPPPTNRARTEARSLQQAAAPDGPTPPHIDVFEKMVDHFPTGYLSVATAGICRIVCIGDDLHMTMTWVYVFTAVDDRGPVTYLSSRIWSIPCGGGSRTFSARDNAGQTITFNITVRVPDFVFRGACNPNNGGGIVGHSPTDITPTGADSYVARTRWASSTVDSGRADWVDAGECKMPPFGVYIPATTYDPMIETVVTPAYPDFVAQAGPVKDGIANTWPGVNITAPGESERKPQTRWWWNKRRVIYVLERYERLPSGWDRTATGTLKVIYKTEGYDFRLRACHDQGTGGTP